MSMFLLIYLVVCACVAMIGRDTLLGPFGIFVVSVVFTPILVLLILVLFGPRHPPYVRYPREDGRNRG